MCFFPFSPPMSLPVPRPMNMRALGLSLLALNLAARRIGYPTLPHTPPRFSLGLVSQPSDLHTLGVRRGFGTYGVCTMTSTLQSRSLLYFSLTEGRPSGQQRYWAMQPPDKKKGEKERRKGKEREEKGRKGKEREGKGRNLEGKRRKGKEREGKGRKGKEGKEKEGIWKGCIFIGKQVSWKVRCFFPVLVLVGALRTSMHSLRLFVFVLRNTFRVIPRSL